MGASMVGMTLHTTPITVRPATAADAEMLRRVAALDSARPVAGDVLVAEADGELVAALSQTDGRVVADPFVSSALAVGMLRLRAAHRAAERHMTRRRRLTRPRLREAA